MTTIRTRSLVFLAVAAWCHVAFADEGVIRVKNSARVTDFNRGNDGDEQKKEKQREFSKSYKNVGMNAPEKFYSFEEHGVYALNQTNFGDDLNPDENWVVEFYAPWCGSCETFKPVYSKIAKDPEYNQDGLKYGAVDCGYSKGVCQVYDIEAMPTLMFFVGELPVVYYGEFKEDAVKEFITGGIGAIEQIRKNLAEQVEQEEKEKEELTIHGEEKLWEMGGSMAVEAAAMQQEYERTGSRWPFKVPAAETFILGMIVGCWLPTYLSKSYPDSSMVDSIGKVITYCSFLIAFFGFTATLFGFDGPKKQFHFQCILVFFTFFASFLAFCRYTGRLHWLKPSTEGDKVIGEMKKAKADKKSYMREHLDMDALKKQEEPKKKK